MKIDLGSIATRISDAAESAKDKVKCVKSGIDEKLAARHSGRTSGGSAPRGSLDKRIDPEGHGRRQVARERHRPRDPRGGDL
jgi:hypothetical protein